MSDWEDSDDPSAPTPATPQQLKSVRKKWEGEDEEESTPASDWDESSEEEEDESKPAPPPAAAPPPKKKGTLKAKLAEKEAAKASRADGDDDDEYDEDAVLDPREKARRDKEHEISADLENAASLLGAAESGGSPSTDLDTLLSANPRTKEDFQALSSQIIHLVIKRHQNKPLFPSFVEYHVRQLAEPLRDVEVRKAASALTTLANEKQREQRDKASGKKKPKSASKPTLGAAKVSTKFDTEAYDEALDDFGKDADDFM